eukprot:comp21640_c0_seq1/m.30404 comp21640_c0_seq1/g.30404  ORF comp21640_c0_seq1/g.30404 comp21640_c0_seq1/m.30404 type:complete len:339 (-) comp21640_c0_seq1:557-1573(-)
MSVEVKVVDEAGLREALGRIRSDGDSTNWVLAHHTGKPDEIALKACGSGGLQELLAQVEDDNVCYALLRVTETVDLSETVKFVYLHFIGPKLSFVKKGRYGIVYGSVTTKFFSPHHVMFPGIEDLGDISDEIVMRKVAEASGTAKHELQSTEGRQVRNFTGKPTFQDSPHLKKTEEQTKPPQFKHVKPIDTKKADLEFGPELRGAVALVRNDQAPVNWVLGTYEGGDPKRPVVLAAKGTGGLDELVGSLDPAKIMYGLLRTTDVYEGITTIKFVYFSFIGEDVPHMQRARISVHKGATEEFFSPYHVAFDGISRATEVTEEAVRSKIAAASGSKNWVK